MPLTCRECAQLLSEKRDRHLPFRQRVALRVHMLFCKMCQVYGAQVAAVSGVCREAGRRAEDECPGTLSEDRKRRIKDALKETD